MNSDTKVSEEFSGGGGIFRHHAHAWSGFHRAFWSTSISDNFLVGRPVCTRSWLLISIYRPGI